MHNPKQLHRIIEGALFAASEPLTIDKIVGLFAENDRPDKNVIRETLQELRDDYQDRGVELKELASGYQFQVRADLSKWIKNLWEERPQRYSRALLETLALVAYRQPITRGEIEEIRGVAVSSPMMKTLMEREWVRIVGHRDVPGKPGLYATTKKFLDYFGLKSLSDMPPLSEIRDIDKIGEKLEEALEETERSEEDEVKNETENEIEAEAEKNKSVVGIGAETDSEIGYDNYEDVNQINEEDKKIIVKIATDQAQETKIDEQITSQENIDEENTIEKVEAEAFAAEGAAENQLQEEGGIEKPTDEFTN